ncbi:leucine rich repeat domain protein [Favolaschia claudopus]|uniref:Leucine rich repeat domain protein n=1 Tax=Favolaschia claudopus TaxID=2862362 RepID=A0AAW0DZ15_9AGAR
MADAQLEPGDVYLRRLATFVRTHEKNLAAAGVPVRRRRIQQQEPPAAIYNPLSWFSDPNPSQTTPLVLSTDTHHLFYTLMRLEAQGLDIGTLDVRIDSPSRPMSYVSFAGSAGEKAETLSIAESFRSTLSAVSGLSLGGGWWRPEPPSLDFELKYLFSSFTKIPALSISAPTKKVIAELAAEPPNENALPLDVFRNLQSLECADIDPRALLGWDRLAESLRSLKIKKSGLEDVSDVIVGAVLDDQARRAGSVSRKRRRRIPNAPSRPPSIYATRLPDSVPEEPEQQESGSSSPPPPTELSSLKWAFLKHLSLSDNSLTFFPPDCVQYLTSLTHLDLSSNLLVSVPPNLSALFNLVSLNLSDNMIDSVLGIYQNLGGVSYINLAHNRLESLCGLERLPSLERVDLRNNLVEESAEVGRLAMLPNISEVWIEGNPFVELEEGYRITCFDYFWKEGKTISLDGSQPGFYEKRGLTVPPPSQMSSSRPVSAAYSPPVVAVGHAHAHAHVHGATSPASSADAGPSSHEASPQMAPVGAIGVSGKARRKVKRIVDLDAGDSDGAGSSRSASHTRTKSDGSSRAKGRPKGKKADGNAAMPILNHGWGQFGALVEEPEVTAPLPLQVSNNNADNAGIAVPQRSRHNRYQSELAVNVSPPASTSTSPPVASPSDTPTATTFRRQRNSATFSARRSDRRSRVSASVYEPVNSISDGEQDAVEDSVDAYRRRIEALKKDMGEGWLKVFTQSS